MTDPDEVLIELPCCGFPVTVIHREGDRAVDCLMCEKVFIIRATPIRAVDYDVEEANPSVTANLRAVRKASQ